jgi:hypothetical protein
MLRGLKLNYWLSAMPKKLPQGLCLEAGGAKFTASSLDRHRRQSTRRSFLPPLIS